VCDVDGAQLMTRADDSEVAIRQRLGAYDVMTRPLLDYYQSRNQLHEVEGGRAPAEVARDIIELVSRELASTA